MELIDQGGRGFQLLRGECCGHQVLKRSSCLSSLWKVWVRKSLYCTPVGGERRSTEMRKRVRCGEGWCSVVGAVRRIVRSC